MKKEDTSVVVELIDVNGETVSNLPVGTLTNESKDKLRATLTGEDKAVQALNRKQGAVNDAITACLSESGLNPTVETVIDDEGNTELRYAVVKGSPEYKAIQKELCTAVYGAKKGLADAEKKQYLALQKAFGRLPWTVVEVSLRDQVGADIYDAMETAGNELFVSAISAMRKAQKAAKVGDEISGKDMLTEKLILAVVKEVFTGSLTD